MFQQCKWYWSKDSLEFCNRKNFKVTLIRMTDAPVTLVDNYWFQAMWTTHGLKCKPPGLAKVRTIVKSNFNPLDVELILPTPSVEYDVPVYRPTVSKGLTFINKMKMMNLQYFCILWWLLKFVGMFFCRKLTDTWLEWAYIHYLWLYSENMAKKGVLFDES